MSEPTYAIGVMGWENVRVVEFENSIPFYSLFRILSYI